MSDQKARKRPSFTVSPPAQTEFRVLGGRPSKGEAVVRAALDAAREQGLAAEARRAAARTKSRKP